METWGLIKKELSRHQRVIEINHKFYPACLNLAIALGEIGRAADAITVLERVIVIKPDYAKAYNKLGIAHEIMRDPEKSIEYYLISKKLYSKMSDEKSEKEIDHRFHQLYKMIGAVS